MRLNRKWNKKKHTVVCFSYSVLHKIYQNIQNLRFITPDHKTNKIISFMT